MDKKEGFQKGAPIALILDNAKIHRSHLVRDAAAREDVNIRLIFSVAGRPDLGCLGIERVWGICKRRYRNLVDREKALNRQFNHMGLL